MNIGNLKSKSDIDRLSLPFFGDKTQRIVDKPKKKMSENDFRVAYSLMNNSGLVLMKML